jgi:hypothetical protein
MKQNINRILVFLVVILFSRYYELIAQCQISASADKYEICLGEGVNLFSSGDCSQSVMLNNFNDGTIGNGWSCSIGAIVGRNANCRPTTNGTNYLWFGNNASIQNNIRTRRIITSPDYTIPSGTTLKFAMRYARDNNRGFGQWPIGCEGPDAVTEGVRLQYSTDGGFRWNTIRYWPPTSAPTPPNDPLVWWNWYDVPLDFLNNTSTRFRWMQSNYTREPNNPQFTHDHWGLEDIQLLNLPNPTVKWSHGPEVFNPPTVYPTKTTTYQVTINNGIASASDEVTIVVNMPPDEVAEKNDTICKGESIKIGSPTTGGTPPYTYEWSPVANLMPANIAQPMATPEKTTEYKVTITDSKGCLVKNHHTVVVHPKPKISAGSDIEICSGDTIKIGEEATGGTPPFTYKWSPEIDLNHPDIAQPEASPKTTTTYIVLVTDKNGCTSEDDIKITVDPSPELDINRNVYICAGDTALIGGEATGGEKPYTYQWNPSMGLEKDNEAQTEAFPTQTTEYTLTVTGANGCYIEKKVTVHIEPIPNAVAGPDRFICYGDSVRIGGDAFCGVEPFTYKWTPASGLSDPTISSPFAEPEKTTTYEVEVTDAIDRKAYDEVTVTVNPEIVFDAGEDTGICFGGEIDIGGEATGGTAPFSYSWSPADGLSDTNSGKVVANPEETTTYHVEVTDANGCAITDEITVEVYPLPEVDAGEDAVLCAGDPHKIGNPATGGTPPYTYSWSPTTFLVNPASAQPEAKATQTTEYTVTVTDANGCKASDKVVLNITPIPTAVAGKDTAVCFGESVEIGGEAYCGLEPYTYSWAPANTLSDANAAKPVATPTETTTYTVEVTDDLGRSDQASVTVYINPLPIVKEFPDTSICPGTEIEIGNEAESQAEIVEYEWTPADGIIGESDISTITVSPQTTTTYRQKIVDKNGCENYDEITVSVNDPPEVTISGETRICSGRKTTLTANVEGGEAPYEYYWMEQGLVTKSGDELEVQPGLSTTYAVEVVDQNGCTGTANMNIEVLSSQATLKIDKHQVSPKERDYQIPVILHDEENLLSCNPNELSFKIEIDAYLFNPTGVSKGVMDKTLSGNIWEIDITIPNNGQWQKNEAVVDIIGDVLLGNKLSTPIEITTASWTPLNLETQRINGELELIGICEQGGERLLTYKEIIKILSIVPNPADNKVEVTIRTVGSANNESISLIDPLGRVISNRSIDIDHDNKGEVVIETITLNTSKLQSGLYYIRFSSDYGIYVKELAIMK